MLGIFWIMNFATIFRTIYPNLWRLGRQNDYNELIQSENCRLVHLESLEFGPWKVSVGLKRAELRTRHTGPWIRGRELCERFDNLDSADHLIFKINLNNAPVRSGILQAPFREPVCWTSSRPQLRPKCERAVARNRVSPSCHCSPRLFIPGKFLEFEFVWRWVIVLLLVFQRSVLF